MSDVEQVGPNMRASEVSPPLGLTRKQTKTWMVNAADDTPLGLVHFRQTWRCYVFAPAAEVEFDPACLEALAAFMRRKTAEQRAAASERRTATIARNRP